MFACFVHRSSLTTVAVHGDAVLWFDTINALSLFIDEDALLSVVAALAATFHLSTFRL